MDTITITVTQPTEEELNVLNIGSWNPWECAESVFDWFYDQEEWCYLFEGKAIVKTEAGDEVEIKKGDLVKFPRALKCTWNISTRVRKVYIFK